MTAEKPMDAFQADLLRFLASPSIANGDGSLYSWVNPDHPGFVYPEAMGLHLRLFSVLAARTGDAELRARAESVLRGLQVVTPASGGVGMEGYDFLFDTCMVAGGLHAYERELGGRVDDGLWERVAAFIRTSVERKHVLVDGQGKVPEPVVHWSRMWGAHILKTVIALDALRIRTGERRFEEMTQEIAGEIITTCLRDGAFRMGPGVATVYCHAHCYALEGLLYLRAAGLRDESTTLRDGAERLAAWQNDDGSMFNWYEDPSRERAKVGDATAQTARIWMAVDPERYEARIRRALGFLATLQSPLSGLFYSDGSRDVNTITSVFATQAVNWHLSGPQPRWLV